MGPPFLRGGEPLGFNFLSTMEKTLQWGRPFYGAERADSLLLSWQVTAQMKSSFNGAALFTGRRDSGV